MSRIISYDEKTGYNDSDYLLLDNSEGGTKRIRADRVGIQLDPTLTDPNKAAPANAVKPVDAVPAQGSSNAVSSGGVWDALQYAESINHENIYSAYPTDTASGSIVTFADGADDIPMKSVKVAIEPVQDLHGQDAPYPAGGGKNLLYVPSANTYTSNGVTWTQNQDGSITISGTATEASTFIYIQDQIGKTFDGDYYFICFPTIERSVFAGGVKFSDWHSFYADTPIALNSISGKIEQMWFQVKAGKTLNTTIYPMIYKASEATPTAWSPYSNICPISGWTGAQVVRIGRNLWNLGDISATRKYQGNLSLFSGTYTFSAVVTSEETGTNAKIVLWDTNKQLLGSVLIPHDGVRHSGTITVSNPVGAVELWAGDSASVSDDKAFTFSDVQVELGSAATSYEPYTGNTYSITFPTEAGTVYGGELDVTNGVLTVDRGYYVVTNATEIVNDGSYTDFNRVNIVDGTGKLSGKPNGAIISNVFKLGLLDVNSVFMHGTTGVINFTPSISIGTTLSEIKAWLIANNAEFCYELAEPITYTLTPTEIKSLLGNNNLWADAGDTEVTYRADTAMYIDKKIAEVINALS